MQDFTEREYVTGTNWDGNEIRFNRLYAGHRFTDDEVGQLLAGEKIELHDLVNKDGNEYSIYGRLAKQSYNGFESWRFNREGYISKPKIRDSWGGHVFTEEEKDLLLSGQSVRLKDCISREGIPYKCTVHYGIRGDGRKGIIPVYDHKKKSGIPRMWSSYTFSDEEMQFLREGRTIHVDGCISAAGKEFSADISYGKRDDGTEGIIATFGKE